MENSENQYNEDTNFKVFPTKIRSDSALQLRQQSVNPNDECNDLHITGFKIQLDDNRECTISLDKATSKSASILTILTDSNEPSGQQAAGARRIGNKATRSFFNIPNAYETTPTINQNRSSKMEVKEERFENVPAIEVKLESNYLQNKGLEVRVKSKTYPMYPSSVDEQQRLNEDCCEKELVGVVKISPDRDGSHSVRYSKESSLMPLKYNTELASTAVQTEKETIFASVQTTLTSESKEDVSHQSENAFQTPTETRDTRTESVETEISIKQVAVQTENETAPMSSQPDTAAIFSIQKGFDATTQAEQTENVASLTNLNTPLVNKKDFAQKSRNTEDLPFALLMMATEEKAEAEIKEIEENFDCSRGHQKQHDCIYKCCYHKDSENELQYLSSIYTPIKCDGFQSCLNRSRLETINDCTEKLKSDLHPRYCCKCAKSAKASNTSTHENEQLENPNIIVFSLKDTNTLSLKEKKIHQPQLEIAKRLDAIKENEKTYLAVKVSRLPKIEKARLLRMPIAFEHYLTSFRLSKLSRSRIVINPVDIKLSEKVVPENFGDKQSKSAIESLADRSFKSRHEVSELPKSIDIEKKSERKNWIAPSKSTSYYSHSQLCPCNMCHLNVEIVRKKEKQDLSEDFPEVSDKESDGLLQNGFRSTSPNQDLNDACEVVNDHLLSLSPTDDDAVRKAAENLHKLWFELVGSKCSDVSKVRYYIQYFKEFSNNLVKTLLHSVDNDGNNVLHFAFANNRFDLVDELLQNGLALELLNKGNKSGNTPLMICSISRPMSHSDWTVVRKCFEFSDVNRKSPKNDQTPLMNAASCGFQAMLDLLLDVGAQPNLQDKDGSTALMYAAEQGHEKCIKSLMRHKKCDPTIRDKDGETACSIALSNGHKNISVLIHMQALEKRRLSEFISEFVRYEALHLDEQQQNSQKKDFSYGT